MIRRAVLIGGSVLLARPGTAAARDTASGLCLTADGRHIIVAGNSAGHGWVRWLDAATGTAGRSQPLSGMRATGVAAHASGWVAVAGGIAGRSGEVRLIPPRGPLGLLRGLHEDLCYSPVWSPDGTRVAVGSYDHLASIWEVEGKQGRPLKDHTDGVTSVAFHPKGDRLVTGSSDRTVKIWDLATGRRIITLTESTAEVNAVDWSPDGQEVCAGGVDKTLRRWAIQGSAGRLLRAQFAHDGAVLVVRYGQDAGEILTGAADRAVKTWDRESLAERVVLPAQSDWPVGVAGGTGWWVVARFDGSVSRYDLPSGGGKVSERWRREVF